MELFEAEGKDVGLVFDISLRHTSDGMRIIDVVKQQVIKLIQNLFTDGLDAFYLYQPNAIKTSNLHGEQVSAVGNYETDGWKFSLLNALKYAVYVIQAEEMVHRKYVILITDRITESTPIEKAMKLSKKEMLDAHFIIIGIGEHYNSMALKQLETEADFTYIHLQHPSELTVKLFQEGNYGGKNICDETTDRCEQIQFTGGHHSAFPWSVRTGDGTDEQFVSLDPE